MLTMMRKVEEVRSPAEGGTTLSEAGRNDCGEVDGSISLNMTGACESILNIFWAPLLWGEEPGGTSSWCKRTGLGQPTRHG